MSLKIEYIPVKDIVPYKNNVKLHPDEQIGQIKRSIEEFGFNDPIATWHGTVVEGHGRLIAAQELGMETVPVIRLDGLSDEQRRAYTLIHNKLTMNSGFDFDLLDLELGDITDIDMGEFGFDGEDDWFVTRERNDDSRQDGNDEYNEFLDKFELKKTTDDCYTPDKVYGAVAEWVANEYGVDRANFVRPFYPGGDYQKYKYKDSSIVVDNPPFSILSEILRWYTSHGIKFFLFAPALTLFSSSSSSCAIGAGAQIVYENGASVNTSFLTNLEMEYRFRTAPTLFRAVEDAVLDILRETKKELSKYEYPDEVVLSSMLNRYSKYGIDFRVRREESEHVRQLDAQKESGKALYGSGYLISEKAAAEKAAAEKAAAEKAAAEKWKLSDREHEIVKGLGLNGTTSEGNKQNRI